MQRSERQESGAAPASALDRSCLVASEHTHGGEVESPRRFVILALGIAGVLVATIGLFNYFVDPYDLYGHNRLGIYISAEREFKASQVKRYPHDALLMGNSRMAMIPVRGLQDFKFFNAGFGGGTAEEAYYFLYHFAHQQKLVILGVELAQADPIAPQGDIFAPRTLTSVLNNLLNLKTVEYSVRTIYSHITGVPVTLEADGSFDAKPWFDRWDKPDPAHLAFIVKELERGYWNFTGNSKLPMTFYSKIAECLRERGITCVVVIPPLYEEVAKRLRDPDAAAKYDGWRSRLRAIFPLVVDLSVSSYCAEENYFKDDPVHFKPDVGVRMLNAEVIPIAERARKTTTDGHR
jgi:hypothetical protein